MATRQGWRDVRADLVQSFNFEEFRRRNRNAVIMDLLYLLTVFFFAYLAFYGTWPAVISAVPLLMLLYFGVKSSFPFFVAQGLAIAAGGIAQVLDLIPL